MDKLFLFTALIVILTSSCKETNKELSTNTISEAESHPFLVNTTNSAWANAEELNKRVSPPKSVISESENGFKLAIHYSSPFTNNRTIWGELVPFDVVWRTGANEATIIEFSDKVKLGDVEVGAGRYSLFSIPKEDGFTIILNSVVDQWGSYEYDEKQDVARFEVESEEKKYSDSMTFVLIGNSETVKVGFVWAERGFSFIVSPI